MVPKPANLSPADAAAKASERVLRATLDALCTHIAILDERGRIIHVNQTWKRFAEENGLRNGHGIGDDYLQICRAAAGISSEGAAEVAVGISEVMAGQRAEFHHEYPCHSPQEQRWFIVRATRFDIDGLIRVVVAHENITERKQAELTARRLACAVEQSPAAILITNLRGQIEYVNTAFCNLTGYTLEEMRGKNPRLLKSGKHSPDFYQSMWEVLLSGKTWRGELRNRKKNGELFWESACISPVRDDRGQATHYVGIKEDITARKLAVEALAEAEQKLIASERQQKAILESIPDPAWLRDRQGRFQMVNPAWCDFARTTAAHALGKTVAEVSLLYPPEVAAEIQADDERVMVSGRSSQVELMFDFPQKGIVWFEVSKNALFDESGTVCGLVGIARDITKRKRALLEVAESKTFLDRILNAIGDPVFVKDRRHRLILVNDANCALIGRDRQEILGKTDFDLFPKEEANGFWLRDEIVFSTGREDLCEEHLTDAAGNVHALLTRKSLYTNTDGEPFIVAVLRDITESKRLEENLRESEEKFRQFAENIHEVFWMTSADWKKLLFVSPAYEKIWGRTCESLYANPTGWLDAIHAEDRPAILAAARNHYTGFHEGIEYRIVRPDGSLRWIRDRAYLIRDGLGQISRVAGIAEDITERRRVEMEEQKKTALLESLVNSSPDGILVTSVHGHKILDNEQCNQLFKIPEHIAKQVDGIEQLQFVTGSMRNPEQFLSKVLHLESHPEETGRDEIEFKDGRVLDRNSAPVFGKNKEYYGRIWTFRDITERKQTEAALRKLACAVEQSPVSIIIADVRGKIEYVNPKFCAVTGYSFEEVRGKNPRLLKSGETPVEIYRQLWAAITAGQEWHGEFHNRKKNGELFWEFASISPIRDEQGKITHFVGLKEDITERKKIEAALQVERDFSSEIINRTSMIIRGRRPDGTTTFVNPAGALITGYRSEELVGKNWFYILYPGDEYRQIEQLFRDYADGNFRDYELDLTTKQGEKRTIAWNSFCRRDPTGEIYEIIGCGNDITERKRMENTLRQSEEKFRKFADNVRAVFWMISADWKTLLYVSPAYEEIWGQPCASLYANPVAWQDGIHPEDRTTVVAAAKADYAGFLGGIEYRVLRPDGTIRWIRDRAYPIRESSGQVERVVGIAEDITENKRVAQQLAELEASEQHARRALAHEQELNLIKSRFVSLVSHEFRTPLSVIKVTGQMLSLYLSQMSQEEQIQELKEIDRATGRMTQMMDQLLLYGRLEAGRMEYKPECVDLESLCRQTISEISDQYGSASPIVHTVNSEVREAFVDKKILSHLLCNLLSNAIKYSFAGQPVTLELSRAGNDRLPPALPEPRAAEYLVLSVRDSGIGIPAADQAKLFRTFHRAANVGNRPGTGMGLTIVKQFVELHRGVIQIESEEGRGTSVLVWLPMNPLPQVSA
jgi:PAS domain S-box-containing protein